MIDLSFSEMLVVAVVAILVIGPKDLPRVMVAVGRWVGRGKAIVREFRHSVDDLVRDAELKDMEKRWADQNQRIMAEHPAEDMSPQALESSLPGDLASDSELTSSKSSESQIKPDENSLESSPKTEGDA